MEGEQEYGALVEQESAHFPEHGITRHVLLSESLKHEMVFQIGGAMKRVTGFIPFWDF